MHTTVEFILFVANQSASKEFYSKVLNIEPVLDVPGMTEFLLSPGCKLGLMPESGIAKIISPVMAHPSGAAGVPRCELYLKVDTPETYLHRALHAGATLVSELQLRNWGDTVAYVADPDGHILAFAK